MFLSFIIPIYNGEAWIKQCVLNLLKMDACEFEIILVDDGSSDHSYEIGEQLSSTYDKVHIYHQDNCGVSAARNLGISKATSEYLVFCDVDDNLDMYLFNLLIRNYQAAEQNDLLFFGVSFDYYYKDICYRKEILSYSSNGLIDEATWKNDLVNMYCCNVLNSVWAKMFRKDIIDSNHLKFNTNMFIYEDLEFVLRYLKYCKSVYHSSDAIYHYRIVEEQNNPGRRLQKVKNLNQFMDLIAAPLKDLMESNAVINDKTCGDVILRKLYLVLVREKNSASKINEIILICQDARLWLHNNRNGLSLSENKYVDSLVSGNVLKIVAEDIYTKMRHNLAIRYKTYKTLKTNKK